MIKRWGLGEAKSEFGLTFDFIGLWNERPVTSEYTGWLKEALKEAGLDPLIVGGDNFASRTVSDLEDFYSLPNADLVDVVGIHYPCSQPSDGATVLNKTLWASEDWSTEATTEGASC
ncbi:hypothetical protein TrLO_g4996 [Triparma laevis f. longispina]|uniref:Glycosyl hydrolase family 59 catalytic domain-containing protein n=1 Tax=Triparma laevis f. longispina TaxID=1714387 RepID=A0A9W7E8Z2_9STRA|nr:hypothetical protein TrLO_g4996 [Triparma laevis f. longispina]